MEKKYIIENMLPLFLKKALMKTEIYSKHMRKPFTEHSMNIDHKRKILFIHIPKCAGKTIRKVIKLSNPSDGADHRSPAEIVHPKTWEAYFTFAVVRNPVDKMISSYRYHTDPMYKGGYYRKHRNLHNMALAEYIFINDHKSQKEMITHKYSKEPIDMILRFENLQEDMKKLFKKIGMDDQTEIPKENVSKKKEIKETKETIMKIIERFKEDFEEFGYSSNIEDYKKYYNW